MTKGYSILQKKLEELESGLIQVLCLPADDHETPYHRQYLSQDIEQRLEFLKNLLSAEVATNQTTNPHHLDHISQRLAQLESDFRKWDDCRTSAVNTTNFDDDDDVGSTCSCMESCFNDDGTDQASLAPETFYEAVVDGKAQEDQTVRAEASGGRVLWIWRYYLVMGSGMIVGAALMLRFCGFSSHYMEEQYQGFLTPT